MTYLTLVCLMYCSVAIRAFQQLNVAHYSWRWVPPVSYCYAVFDVLVFKELWVALAAGDSLGWMIFAMGTGGWLGAYSAMWLRLKINGRQKKVS